MNVTNIDEPSRADNNHLLDRTVEIERLASLDPIDYETVRAEAADRLGFRAHILDRAVKNKRRALGLESPDDDPAQGRAVKIADVLPWHEDIDGDRVATALAASLKRYVVLPDAAADAVALWVLHTWLIDKFIINHAPAGGHVANEGMR